MEYIDKSAVVAVIPKSAVVAEIEKRINFNAKLNAHSRLDECNAILSFINNLEVKEVDLEKEIKRFTMSKELFEADSVIKAVAKHFFELGLKVAKKGE